jgi:hypothetical protein
MQRRGDRNAGQRRSGGRQLVVLMRVVIDREDATAER